MRELELGQNWAHVIIVSRSMNAKSLFYALNAIMPNIAVQNASDKTSLVTKAGVNNIVLLTLLSLTDVGDFGVIYLELASQMISHYNTHLL